MKRTGIMLCVVLLAPSMAAQTLRISGVVRDSQSTSQIPGAVVSQLDAANASLGRVITGADGQYSMILANNATQLRVVRIGFQPRVVPIGDRRSGSVPDIIMTRIPTLLTSVQVNDDRVCSQEKNRAAALSLWEQARAGLLASVVARETRPAHTTLYSYERAIDASQNRVIRQTAHTSTGETTRPFISPSEPVVLAKRGYAETDASGGVYFKSPDADVLLDKSFAQTHCFTVRAEDREHVGQIGLAFEPVRARESIVDVRGTLWLESGTPALKTIEFRYTGTNPVLSHERAVGRIQFRTMPNGVVFIDEWQVTLPVLQQSNAARDARTGGMRLLQLSETGGLVLSAAWADGAKYETSLRPVSGVVRETGSAKTLPGVMVSMTGTIDTVLTDKAGRFAFFPVLPGRYEFRAADTTLFEFARAREMERMVDVTAGQMPPIVLELPSRAVALKRYCSEEQSATSAVVVGRIVDRDANKRDLTDVRVMVSWWQLPLMSANAVAARKDSQVVNVDDIGRFSFCRVPRGRNVGLTVSHLGAPYADTLVTVPGSAEVVTVSWPIQLEELLRLTAGKRGP